MQNIRNITEDLIYLGCSDRKLALFESLYPVPDGVSYNSYLLKDDKTVLFDTVDKACAQSFHENLKSALDGRNLDYIVIHHVEPDHCALLAEVLAEYPDAVIVCTAKALSMINQFFRLELKNSPMIVKEGDVLNTGGHELAFYMAPMVHWPEVMVCYDKTSKILFSADAFGSFGAINGNLFDDEVDSKEYYLEESRRYYTNIVGKYGLQVQMLLKKAQNLDIKMICPLHGLILKQDINFYLEKYTKWASYEPEYNGVLIAFSSVYGGTENAVDVLTSKLAQKGVRNIKIFDVSRIHPSYVLAQAFKYSHIVLATTTYNASIFETMETFVNHLCSHNLQNRKFVLIQNGSWAPNCCGIIKEKLSCLKNTEILDESISISSTMKSEQLTDIDNVVNTIVKSLN